MKKAVNITGSLKMKMLIIFGLITIIGCLMLTFVSINRVQSVLESEAKETMFKVVKQAAESADSKVQARLYVVEEIAAQNVIRGIQGDREATMEEKMKALQDALKRTESQGFKRFAIVDKTGNARYPDGTTANLGDRDYFKAAMEGKSYISSSIISKVDNTTIFAYAVPIRHYSTNEVTGVLVGIVDGSRFNELISSITYGRTGYALAIDNAGKTIAHKELERVKKEENILELAKSNQSLASLAAVISKMSKGEEGIGSYTFQGQEKIIAYAPIKTTGWGMALTAPKSEIFEKSTGLRSALLVISIIVILIALVITFIVAVAITNPLVLAVNHLGLISNGDFTMPVPEKFLRHKDEIGKLAGAVDKLQANLRPLIDDLKKGVQTLAGSSENLSASSEEIASSSNEVAKAIQQVAAGAGEQTGNLQEILKLFEKMAQNLEQVYTKLNKVKDNSDNTWRLAKAGKKELDMLVASIRQVRESFEIVVSKVSGLTNSVNQVGDILDAINGIADQTNLLALNAAVEAARAGEAGRGFAVVAEEVRKLAEESRASSNKIRVMLGNITKETTEVADTSNKVSSQVELQLENVERSIKSFNDILESVEAIVPEIEETYRQVDSTVRNKDAVLESVHSVSSVSEENSASAEEISASAEELSATTEEIAASAQEILSVAKNLEKQAERFKV